jgi:hypothetical protein
MCDSGGVFAGRGSITELLEVSLLREILAYPSVQSRAKFARNFIDLPINSTGTIIETLDFLAPLSVKHDSSPQIRSGSRFPALSRGARLVQILKMIEEGPALEFQSGMVSIF